MEKQARILQVENAKGMKFKIGDKITHWNKVFTIKDFKVRNNYTYQEHYDGKYDSHYIMAIVKKIKGSSLVASNIDFLKRAK